MVLSLYLILILISVAINVVIYIFLPLKIVLIFQRIILNMGMIVQLPIICTDRMNGE